MSGHGYCAHGRTAAAVATGMTRAFADDVAAHLSGKACAAHRHPDPFAPGSPERAALEAAVEVQLR